MIKPFATIIPFESPPTLKSLNSTDLLLLELANALIIRMKLIIVFYVPLVYEMIFLYCHHVFFKIRVTSSVL